MRLGRSIARYQLGAPTVVGDRRTISDAGIATVELDATGRSAPLGTVGRVSLGIAAAGRPTLRDRGLVSI